MSSFTDGLSYEPTDKFSRNRRIYRITKSFSYHFGSYDNPIAIFTIPVGFETDFASIPPPFDLFFKPTGKYSKAAALHDFLCGNPHISNVAKDSIFLESMRVLGVGKVTSFAFFFFVRIYHDFFDPKRHDNEWLTVRRI